MAHFICPGCGSEFFLTNRTGRKTVFKVAAERVLQLIQPATEDLKLSKIDIHNIFCGACSWHGSLDELVESCL